ncbi:hypothetical protein ACWGKQ_25435 [Streptomyces sp. NPDC054770]
MALAWLVAQGPYVLPIPGTKTPKYLADNAGAADVRLSPADLGRSGRDPGTGRRPVLRAVAYLRVWRRWSARIVAECGFWPVTRLRSSTM